jgi:GxxExxY protein
MAERGLAFERQVPLPIHYKDTVLDAGYRLDFVVEQLVVVELKAVETSLSIHQAQLLTYLKLSGKPVGLLLNFNVRSLRQGISRFVNT